MLEKRTLQKILIWPLSIRWFHWILVILMALLFLTIWKEEAWLKYHIHLGYVCLGLICWRVFYGFYGPFYLRFKGFVVSPKELLNYMGQLVKGKPPAYVGHPPPSGWWVVLVFIIIILSCVSGILVFNGEERHAFGFQFSNETGDFFRFIHQWTSWFLALMIFVHVVGVLLDSFHHRLNLTKAMFTGQKPVPVDLFKKYQKDHHASSWSRRSITSLTIILMMLGVVAFQQSEFLSPDIPPVLELSESGLLWKEECAACHQLYHPSLLPARSWEKMISQLEEHFGEDASLEEADSQMIFAFLSQNSAEHFQSEPAHKIMRSLSPQDTPLAISDTPYWVQKHEEIALDTFQRPSIISKSNCQACHQDATSGAFEDHLISIPKE